MKPLSLLLAFGIGTLSGACVPLEKLPVGNANVPEPSKPVDLSRYLGKWYEQARYEANFQAGCEAVSAQYALKADGTVAVINSCRQGSPSGALKRSEASARVVEGSKGTKLKVTFFWPFEGDYWVLDRAPDYSWSIVGEPSGRYLWILTRSPAITPQQYSTLVGRAKMLGYNTALLRRTQQ